jgi:hypothetical protein
MTVARLAVDDGVGPGGAGECRDQQSGTALRAKRRMGKTEFLTQDLSPAAYKPGYQELIEARSDLKTATAVRESRRILQFKRWQSGWDISTVLALKKGLTHANRGWRYATTGRC